MEIPVSKTSIAHASDMEVPPTMPIIEYSPEFISQSRLVIPSRKKRTGHRTIHQKRTKSSCDAKESGSRSETMFPGYIPLRKYEAHHVTINNNSKYARVNPSISKEVHVMTNILLNLKKMGFVNHDLWNFIKFAMS